MRSDNQRFLENALGIIRSDPIHPLRFLLSSKGQRFMTLEGGSGNYYDVEHQAIFEGRINGGKPAIATRSSEIAEQLGVSVSCDACHLVAKQHLNGEKERFALGIAELNRADGQLEKSVVIEHKAVDIAGVPVVKEHAQLWEDAGLLNVGTVGQRRRAPVGVDPGQSQ